MGEGLKQVLLDLLNQCRSKVQLAEMMKLANITSIWKRKASRMNLQNDIGIVVLKIFRMIMYIMLYDEKTVADSV